MGKEPIVSVTCENERISIKKTAYLTVTSLLCGPRADLWPFFGFLCKQLSLYIKVYLYSKVSCFLLKSFHIRRLRKR